ncbi:uncharacterized protein BXZ73DRAFT_3370, partial [Epithele typhae]|uniref:uncharacterized protein n=1 Tax=Epithele typhae TaxID=378194 RepID=UPI002007E8F0
TSTRAPVPPVDLKARIAALQQQQSSKVQAGAEKSGSQTLPKANAVTGPNAFRDRIASFEKQGAVPKPKGRFGFAPPREPDAAPSRAGELYGNRVPGLSRPHIPVPAAGGKPDKPKPRDRSMSRMELDRYASIQSPPDSPFVASDTGDSAGDILSDGDPDSAGYSSTQADAQQISLDAMLAEVNAERAAEAAREEAWLAEVAAAQAQEVSEPVPEPTPEPPREPTPPPREPTPEPEPSPAAPEIASPAIVVSPTFDLPTRTSDKAASSTAFTDDDDSISADQLQASPGLDPAVLAVIEVLDRATQSGDEGAVFVPSAVKEQLASMNVSQEHQNTIADMLDQLLLQEDLLDVATPVKQRFSLTASLSSMAVRSYLAQQTEQAANFADAKPVVASKQTAVVTQSSSQNLDPSSPVSPEPVSPASDILSAYMISTPAIPFARALPAIPEAPDSPISRHPRRGTFGMDSDTTSPPSSAPIQTPSDAGKGIPPSAIALKKGSSPPRVVSPPLSVVIPKQSTPKPTQDDNARINAPSNVPSLGQGRPLPSIGSRPLPAPAPAPAHALPPPPAPAPSQALPPPPPAPAVHLNNSDASSPLSNYSPNSAYSDGTSPSSNGPVSRKPSSRGRKTNISPIVNVPYEEPVLTPIEGRKGFHAVVHEKVVEPTMKSRPASAIMQYTDIPSPTPMNAKNMSDLAALFVDAAMLEKQLESGRTPRKALPKPAERHKATPPPTAARAMTPDRRGTPERHGTPDRPRPTQDLPESPEDPFSFSRLSQDRSSSSRTSSQFNPHQSQHEPRSSTYESRPLPSRPPSDRTINSKASRPSMDHAPSRDRTPSRPSVDQSGSARPSAESSSSSRPHLQPMFLNADPNAVRIPLPARPKSAMATSSQRSASSAPAPAPKSPPSNKQGSTGYLTNLLSRAKSSGNLRDSAGSSSEDSALPPTPPYDATETASVRSSKMFKNSISRASNFADRLLHRKDGSNQNADVAIANGDDDDDQEFGTRGSRTLRPLPLPPRPTPPRGLPPPVPGGPPNLALPPIPGQQQPSGPGLQRRGSWRSFASVSTTDINEALNNVTVHDGASERTPIAPIPRGLPPGPNAYTQPRPAPTPPLPPPNQPLPPPPGEPLRAPSRGVSV